MTKPIYSCIKYVAACALMIGVAWSAEARRFIYYCGDYNNWPTAVESNMAQFEDFKLYETAEGSNIYSGTISDASYLLRTAHYFSFYTQLTSDEDYSNGQNPYCTNRLFPDSCYTESENMQAGYKFGFNNPSYYPYNSWEIKESWKIELPTAGVPIKFTVDFNNKTVSAVTDATVLVVNDETKPTIDNIAEYSCGGRQMYVPAGECRFRAYNLFRDTYYSLSGDTAVKSESVTLNTESDAFCTVPNWGGGTLAFTGIYSNTVTINNRYQSLNDENPYENWGETAYIVGTFTGWSFSTEFLMTYENGIFYGTIPADAGNCEFKITNTDSWEDLDAGEKSRTTAGNSTFVTASWPGFYNIMLNVTEEMNISFEPARQAVKIWPASQDSCDPEPEGFFNDNSTIPVIPKFTGIVLEQKDMFVDLTKVAPSEVGIENLTAFPTTGESKYQFTINDDITKPFRFLQFKDDKLVAIFQPVNDVELQWVGDTAHGRIITAAADEQAAYWTSTKYGETTVTIDPQSNDLNGITFKMPSLIEPGKLYFRGSPNDWGFSDTYMLKETNDGKFYGAFNFDAGTVEFKLVFDSNWADPIYGSYDDTAYITGNTHTLSLTSDNNNPNISFLWDGGTVYMLADLRNMTLLLSKEPIDVTISGETIEQPDGILVIDSATGERKYGSEIADGVFRTTLSTDYNNQDAPHRVKIIRTKHTFSENEPEYLDSYTLTFADTQLTAGEDGVAETSFIFNDGVNVGGGNEIEIKPTGHSANMLDYYVIVDFNTGKIYFDDFSCIYLVESSREPEKLSYATRKDFADCRHNCTTAGHIMELPEGEATINTKYLTIENNRTEETEATFDAEGVAKTDFWSTINYPDVVRLHNCPGGEVFVSMHRPLTTYGGCNFYMIALDKIKTFDAISEKWNDQTFGYDQISLGQLTLSDAVTKTYSGQVNVPGNDGYSWFKFNINSDPDFSFGGTDEYLIIDDATKTATYDIDPKSLAEGVTFGNTIAPTVDITLSLEAMNATVKLVEGETKTVFTINTGAGDIVLPPVSDDTNITYNWSVRKDSDDYITFNMTADDGSVIVPADGDTEMTFDADGVFTGDLAVIKNPSATTRRAPLTAGKWYYYAGEDNYYDVLEFNFDLVNNKVTFISQNNAVNLYAVAAAAGNTRITDLALVKDGTLRSNDDGTYSAKVHVAEGENLYIARRNNGSYVQYGSAVGLAPQAIYSRTIDLNDETVDIPVMPVYQYFNGWTIGNNPGCDITVTYNPAMMTLHLDMETAGVENVCIDDNYGDTEPVYYNLQGMRVTNPESGHIYIELRGNKSRKILK